MLALLALCWRSVGAVGALLALCWRSFGAVGAVGAFKGDPKMDDMKRGQKSMMHDGKSFLDFELAFICRRHY
jgi:hypothetical protein